MTGLQHRPLRIGLTGGIASGKSVVTDLFAELGIPVIDTDLIARDVVAPGEPALEAVHRRFGDGILNDDGTLDRAALRRIVFADAQARLDLEAILHPAIGEETRRRAAAADGPYQLIVVPLLVDSPLLDFVDRVLVVDCPVETQLERLVARDAESMDQAKRMIAAQATRGQRLEIADDVIVNDADLEATREQVLALDARYRELAAQS